jgi:hypothetical protein
VPTKHVPTKSWLVTCSQPNNHTNYYLHPLIHAWFGLHEIMNQALPSIGTKHMEYSWAELRNMHSLRSLSRSLRRILSIMSARANARTHASIVQIRCCSHELHHSIGRHDAPSHEQKDFTAACPDLHSFCAHAFHQCTHAA